VRGSVVNGSGCIAALKTAPEGHQIETENAPIRYVAELLGVDINAIPIATQHMSAISQRPRRLHRGAPDAIEDESAQRLNFDDGAALRSKR
jgi:hypothetical protein